VSKITYIIKIDVQTYVSCILVEGDKALQGSKVRDHINEMIKLLREEDERWSYKLIENNEEMDNISELPCIEAYLHYRVMPELCNRALKDRPRGCLPIILSTASSILKKVRYPLLPHQTVHVPLGQLISFATRYDGLHASDKPGMLGYKKRIGAVTSYTTLATSSHIRFLLKSSRTNQLHGRPFFLSLVRLLMTKQFTQVKNNLILTYRSDNKLFFETYL